MARTRTFIAIEASPEIRAHAVKLGQRLRSAIGDVKWVTLENLHWTLQFLGDVDDLEIPKLCYAAAGAIAEIESFPLAALGVGAFPTSDRPHTLWIGAGQGAAEMCDLQSAIENRLRQLGYRGENRRFVPHLTIGRCGRTSHTRPIADELAVLAEFDAGTMIVDEVTVFASRLARGGSIYEPLSRMPLE